VDLGALGKAKSRRHSKSRGSHFGIPRVREKLRITSNIGLIVGQCILLFVDREWGLRFIICSSMLSFPYFVHHKYWDVVLLMCFLNTVNIVGLFVQ
jgi:hypothetical protein